MKSGVEVLLNHNRGSEALCAFTTCNMTMLMQSCLYQLHVYYHTTPRHVPICICMSYVRPCVCACVYVCVCLCVHICALAYAHAHAQAYYKPSIIHDQDLSAWHHGVHRCQPIRVTCHCLSQASCSSHHSSQLHRPDPSMGVVRCQVAVGQQQWQAPDAEHCQSAGASCCAGQQAHARRPAAV